MGRGEISACLGYTEPSGGSDVLAAKTRAVRDGDDWIINGAKMFTSGAELASYVILITRTAPDAPQHKGITVFLLPLHKPGDRKTAWWGWSGSVRLDLGGGRILKTKPTN